MDTRNVGVHEVIVEVEDLPDTPPYFLIAPPVTRLAETATIVSVNSLLMLGFKHFISWKTTVGSVTHIQQGSLTS